MLQSFTEHYFHRKLSRLSKHKLAEQVAAITTLIIDTPSLATGEMVFDRALSFNNSTDDTIATANRALSGTDNALSRALKSSSQGHISIISGRVLGTVWHHGTRYTSAWIGKPTAIAHHADLTDTEREQLLLECRKLAAHGSDVYAVAEASHDAAPTTYRGARAKIVGLLVFHPQLHHTIEETVAAIHQAGIAIVYASKDSEHTVQMFATASLIAPNSIPFTYRPGRTLPNDGVLYASLTDKKRAEIIHHYPATSVLVVNEPLPVFWKSFTTFL